MGLDHRCGAGCGSFLTAHYRSATQRRGAKRNHDFLKKRHLGYLYEMPLLVLIITFLSTILWPLLSGPWRLVLEVISGISVLLLLWYHRSR